jgi:hypothetical protein
LREGIVVTRFLRGAGTGLVINGSCGPGGSIHVEVVDIMDRPLGNCSKANCDPFTGDAVEHRVTWKGDPTIPDVSGNDSHPDADAVKLRFYLRGAELFSFRFV